MAVVSRFRFRILVCALAWVALLGPACASGDRLEPVRLEIRVDARAVAPGEPLRIHVGSNYALESLAATLLGDAVFMTAADETGLRWSGWSMIGLDQEPADRQHRVSRDDAGRTRGAGDLGRHGRREGLSPKKT